MNSEKLVEITKRLLETEQKLGTQSILKQLEAQMSNLANQPQVAAHQKEVAQRLEQFQRSLTGLIDSFPPKDIERIKELDSEGFFASNYIDALNQEIAQNAMTPEVARSKIENSARSREEFIEYLEQLVACLDYFQLGYDELADGEAELGIQIPREMFDNDLEGLRRELRDFSLIARWFSEATTGEKQKVVVESISTSDPLFMFSFADAATLAAIAKAFEWALGCWEKILNIRKMRADAEESGEFEKEEIEEFYGKRIERTVEKAISEKLSEISQDHEVSSKSELGLHLRTALRWILSKTEQGYAIELRLAAPNSEEGSNEDVDIEVSETDRVLRNTQRNLVFSEAKGSPVLSVPDLYEAKNSENSS